MKLLKETLYRKCLSQAELASRAGVSRATVSGILSGNRNPSPRTKRQIAAALQIPPTDLFPFRGEKQ
jgi:transcriptional regulator with XRE-family HTH domain